MTLDGWFASRGWSPFGFQREVWRALAGARSGLLHATTGSGKTYAVWLGALQRAERLGMSGHGAAPPLGVLWLTPMRALAADTVRALREPASELAPAWSIGLRTGDTPAAERARQDRRLPTALVTTPESLSLLLTRADARDRLAGVHTVIVDEWHELIGGKRGVQVQLALARLRRWNPALVTWGLSATLGNLADAMRTLVGSGDGVLVQGRIDKPLVVDTLLPQEPGRFGWGGHLGAQMRPAVVAEIERASTTLVFTNTRSQAEIWYQLLLEARPDWAGLVALHHGSLDKSVREWVELGLREGRLKAVVATSSLDLGVDFLPVERVLQIGSAKGVARLLQRAGRSGHAPGRASRVTLVPTNTLELVEAAAARRAALAGRVESRASPDKPLDVLVQHLVTVALGGGFDADALFDEVRTAPAYRTLTRDEFDWALAFVVQGGASLHAYPEYHRVQRGADGVHRVVDRGIALRHRLQVGTIVSDAAMQVKWTSGGNVGTIEEGFIARLKPGDHFVFAGRVLEYVRAKELTAYVRKATRPQGIVPAWAGSTMPLSSEMADAVQALIEGFACGDATACAEPEIVAATPMLATQQQRSRLPRAGRLLVERYRAREGEHLFLYPFGGRHVHIGLAQLLAWRLARTVPNTCSLSVNDYGLEILAARPLDLAALHDGSLFATTRLAADVLASLGSGALAQRRFREIARVAGLVFGGYPGAPKSLRQLQASSSLFYEVFRKYDAGNLLLTQADGEVLAQELELTRLCAVLDTMAAAPIDLVELAAPSPFALPLMVERLREQLSTEKLKDRLARLLADAERGAMAQSPATGPPRGRARRVRSRATDEETRP
ncbi:ligase-associated DNA damage response DEXH box helicase [Azohydromonas sp.]|uniref:ligase-associated DNA damage response DEXH box helicase n=1 Tax=Azohydromonas sp. TaxID=1872666 RepID=UPI002CA0A374|nr:ligase-associated DNA damage response DEXH box helicase [Azohydromonas sp.]HMM84294.1 ligase-associated DNA damage response DEXH box helicase [Azohydromonas sp.]